MKGKVQSRWWDQPRYWQILWWGALACVTLLITASTIFNRATPDADGNYGVWLNLFDQVIKSGQWSPQWIKDVNLGSGSPLFIFYPPLFYYLSEIPRLLGASLALSIKFGVVASAVIGFTSMYWLGRAMWGKWSGLVAAILYSTAIYHVILFQMRGGLAENLAYGLYPLVFLFLYQTLWQRKTLAAVGLGIALALIAITDIPALLLISVALLLFVLGYWILYRSVDWRLVGLGCGLGVLLSGWFTIPVAVNLHLINANFFISNAGLGLSLAKNFANPLALVLRLNSTSNGANQQHFFTGLLFWPIVIGSGIIWWNQRKTKLFNSADRIVPILLGLLVVAVLMTQPLSAWLWENLIFIKYIQYPLRWLGLLMLISSLLGGYLVTKLNYKLILGLVAIAVGQIFLIVLFATRATAVVPSDAHLAPYAYLRAHLQVVSQTATDWDVSYPAPATIEPGYLPRTADLQKLHNRFWGFAIPGGFLDLSVDQASRYDIPISQKIITTGQLTEVVDTPTTFEFTHTANTVTTATYAQFAFPGWRVAIDGRPVTWHRQTEPNGYIGFVIPAGVHRVIITYHLPPGALTGRWLTALTIAGLLAGWAWPPVRRRKQV